MFYFKNNIARFALPIKNGGVAQLVRAQDSYPPAGGRQFELTVLK
jgi:hypothetical protein